MTIGRIIDWLGELSGCELAEELRSERVLKMDSVLRASIILKTKECSLLRLHDIEGVDVRMLQKATGMPAATLQQKIAQTRLRLKKTLVQQPAAICGLQEGET